MSLSLERYCVGLGISPRSKSCTDPRTVSKPEFAVLLKVLLASLVLIYSHMECTRRRVGRVRAVFSTHYTVPFPLSAGAMSQSVKSPSKWFKTTQESPLRLAQGCPPVRCRRLKSIGVRITLSPKHQPSGLLKVDRSTSIEQKESSPEPFPKLLLPLSLRKVLKVREVSQPFLSPWEVQPSVTAERW